MLPVFEGLNLSSKSEPQVFAASLIPVRATWLIWQRATVNSRSSAS